MPHQCTECGRTFDDGSKEMLSGCPDCGGNKFQFLPDGADPASVPDEEPPEPPEPSPDSSVARTVGKAAATVRDVVGDSSSTPDTVETDPDAGVSPEETPTAEPPAETGAAHTTGETDPGSIPVGEDAAQADARSQIVSPDELPSGTEGSRPVTRESSATNAGGSTPASDSGGDEPAPESADRPDLAELREELNDQFESIRVVERGQYELNLMELYDREEYIIALQEDGRYVIQVPETLQE